MLGLNGVLNMMGSAMSAESININLIASNLANAGSVGPNEKSVYRSKHPVFKTVTDAINGLTQRMQAYNPVKIAGMVSRITGFLIEAFGLKTSIGSLCRIVMKSGHSVLAEVVGFSCNITYLIPYGDIIGITAGDQIFPLKTTLQVPVGFPILGRVFNGLGQLLDKGPPLTSCLYSPLHTATINPIERARITAPLDVGIRAINSLLTVGQGQRLGIVAGTGVGKSVLLGMITNYTSADVVVVGLIGERGREVKEFIEENIGQAHLNRTVIVASPVNHSPLEHVNAALVATTMAEYFRDQGKNVLLIVDSLTRYAQALRKIYLTLGEPPSSRGYSPSVFNKLSQLVERAGHGAGEQGCITAFYTVLTEGEDLFDPVADHARSILDGHIVLSRKLAEKSHYPAIDVSASISRVMTNIVSSTHLQQAQHFKKLYATYEQNMDLVNMGMYQPGSNPLLDEALAHKDSLLSFLTQSVQEKTDFSASLSQLQALFSS